jgi:hypothetical protein
MWDGKQEVLDVSCLKSSLMLPPGDSSNHAIRSCFLYAVARRSARLGASRGQEQPQHSLAEMGPGDESRGIRVAPRSRSALNNRLFRWDLNVE